MNKRKLKTTVYLTPQQHKQLTKLTAETGIPTAVLIRKGIDLVLRWQKGS